MKTYEVVIQKQSKVEDWCLYGNREYYRTEPTTTAVIVAFNLDRLKQKLETYYKGFEILKITELK